MAYLPEMAGAQSDVKHEDIPVGRLVKADLWFRLLRRLLLGARLKTSKPIGRFAVSAYTV